MNALFETVIAKVLSPYIENVSREKIEVGIMSGNLQLTDLKIRETILSQLKLDQLVQINQATVELVSVKIPWSNPLYGQIQIKVKGVSLRVAEQVKRPHHETRTQLLASRRALIDSIKQALMESGKNDNNGSYFSATKSKLLGDSALYSGNSFAAKLVRKLINSIVVTIGDVYVSLDESGAEAGHHELEDYLDPVHAEEEDFHDVISETDRDTNMFRDAIEEPDNVSIDSVSDGGGDSNDPVQNASSLISVSLKELSLFGDSGADSTLIGKKFCVTDFCMHVNDTLFLPPSSLLVDFRLTKGVVDLVVSGMNSVDRTVISKFQLETLNRVAERLAEGMNTQKETGRDSNGDKPLMALYEEMYAKMDRTPFDLDQMESIVLSVDPASLAEIEARVDLLHAKAISPAVPLPKKYFWSTSAAPDAVIEKFDKSIVEQVDSATPLEIPSKWTVAVAVGKQWNVCLVTTTGGGRETVILDFNLKGVDLELSANVFPDSGSVEGSLKLGLGAFTAATSRNSKRPIVEFRESGEAAGDVGSKSEDFQKSFSIDVRFEKPSTKDPLMMCVTAAALPMWFRYEPGLVSRVSSYFDFFHADNFAISEENQKYISESAAQAADYVRRNASAKVAVKLSLAGPYICLPSHAHSETQIRLGDFCLDLPFETNVEGGDTQQSLACTASIANARVLCVYGSNGESRLVMAPVEVNLRGLLLMSERTAECSLCIDQPVAFSLSSRSIKTVGESVTLLLDEFGDDSQSLGDSSFDTDSLTISSAEFAKTDIARTKTASPIRFVNINTRIRTISLTVTDGCVDILSAAVTVPNGYFQVDLESPKGVGQKDTAVYALIDGIQFSAKTINQTIGVWEPLVETTRFSITLGFGTEEHLISERSSGDVDGSAHTPNNIYKECVTIRVDSSEPVNFVVSPSSIQTMNRFLLDVTSPHMQRREHQYRIVNATTSVLYLCVPRRKGTAAKTAVEEIFPSNDFFSFDTHVLNRGATEVLLSASKLDAAVDDFSELMETMGNAIVRVPLERNNSVLLETDGNVFLVQSILSANNSYRTIVVSHNAFVHNHCSVPLELSYERGLPTPSAVWLGAEGYAKNNDAKNFVDAKNISPNVILSPGTFVSVPFVDLQFSIKPLVADNSSPIAWSNQRIEFHDWTAHKAHVCCGHRFFIQVEGRTVVSSLPLSGRVFTVDLRAPFAVRNETPVDLQVSLRKQPILKVPAWRTSYSYFGTDNGKPRVGMSDQARPVVDRASAPTMHMSSTYYPRSTGGSTNSWTPELTETESRHLLSPDDSSVAPVHFTFSQEEAGCLLVTTKWRLIDRTGLPFDVRLEGVSLPKVDAKNSACTWLLPDPDKPCAVSVYLGREYLEVVLPDNGWTSGWVSQYPVVFVARESFSSVGLKYVEILPKFTVFNALREGIVLVAGGAKETLEPMTGTVVLKDSFGFSVIEGGQSNNVSCPIPLHESMAGVWPVQLTDPSSGSAFGDPCRVEISPVDGCIAVTIRPGSSVKVRNEKYRKTVYFFTDQGNRKVRVPPRSERFIGWVDPFRAAQSSTTLQIGDVEDVRVDWPVERKGGKNFLKNIKNVARRSTKSMSHRTTPTHPAIINVSLTSAGDFGVVSIQPDRKQPQSIVVVVKRRVDVEQPQQQAAGKYLRVELHCASATLSVMSGGAPREVMFAELSLIRAAMVQTQKFRKISLLVSDMQVESGVSVMSMITNEPEGVKPVLELVLEQRIDISYGVSVWPLFTVEVGNLIVEVDSAFMTAVDDLLNDLVQVVTVSSVSSSDVLPSLIQKGTISQTDVPTILVLDRMDISSVRIKLWVDFALKEMKFLPVSLKILVKMLSLGSSFRLDGASVDFRHRVVPGYKGSLVQFSQSLAQEYGTEALRNMANLLGNSSLLTIPRAPIQLVAGAGALGLEKATGAVGNVGGFLSNLAGDPKYREAQARIRADKKIKGFADGFVEGATRIGEGAEALLDIVRHPIRGAQRTGVKGFFKGIGTGLIGTVVKPVTKLGEAIQDVGIGIARTVGPGKGNRPVFERKRMPRPFYGKRQFAMEYKPLDAFLLSELGNSVVGGMELVVPLESGLVAVLFGDKILIVKVDEENVDTDEENSRKKFSAAIVEKSIPLRSIKRVQKMESADQLGAASLMVELVESGENENYCMHFKIPKELVDTVVSVISSGIRKGHMDWSGFRAALFGSDYASIVNPARSETDDHIRSVPGGTKRIEVFEVERFLMTFGWITPYLLLDGSTTAWRWVDRNFHKHSKINPRISKSAAVKSKTPPLHLGDLWKPADEWRIEIDPHEKRTDQHGWQYAVSFSSSTWLNNPGITASVRKRKWIRNYT